MLYFSILTMMVTMMILMLLTLNMFLSKKKNKMRNKMTPFECGFDPLSKLRLPFSINFYLITIIFLIFDLEISLMLPMMKNFNILMYNNKMLMIYLMSILIMGLYYEWKEGSLKWLN